MSVRQKEKAFIITPGEIKNRWEQIAYWYADLINEGEYPPRKNIIDPVIKNLIMRLNPKTVFDAGCGEGYMSRFMAEKGIMVVGGDISTRMIEVAMEKERARSYGIKYFTVNLEDISKNLISYSFDLILCHLVLMNVVNLQKVFANFYKLLSNDGSVIISITHPFPLEKESQWFSEEVVDNNHSYFDIFWKFTTFYDNAGYPSPVKVLTCHRPLHKYFDSLKTAGFLVSDIIEPKSNTRIPLYMVIGVVKK